MAGALGHRASGALDLDSQFSRPLEAVRQRDPVRGRGGGVRLDDAEGVEPRRNGRPVVDRAQRVRDPPERLGLPDRLRDDDPEAVREPEPLRRIAQALRAIHNGPPIPARFDAFRVVEAYAATATAHGIALPDGFERARELAVEVERARGAVPERPCHNDLLTSNLIDDGTRIRIVDWEYAGMGDVFFDLANFAVNNGLPAPDTAEFLHAYYGTVTPEQERALTLMRFMSDFREAMWGVVQQALSDLDFDFAAYAQQHFERLERTAGERAFRRALA